MREDVGRQMVQALQATMGELCLPVREMMLGGFEKNTGIICLTFEQDHLAAMLRISWVEGGEWFQGQGRSRQTSQEVTAVTQAGSD